jgi:hypothetical protein
MVVSDSNLRKIKENIFVDYDSVDEFDLSNEGNKAVKYMTGGSAKDVGVVLRNFEDADDEIKEEISNKIKSFFESSDPESNTDILIVGGDVNDLFTYCPELRLRVEFYR